MPQAIKKHKIFEDKEKADSSNIDVRTLAVPIAYNEEHKIGSVIDRFTRSDVTDIVLMDDASTDNTPRVVKDKGLKVISHKEQKGVGSAIRTAIEYAIENGYDVLIILAGNDKDRPAEIPRLINPIIEDNYDFVQGSRYLRGGNFGNMPFYRHALLSPTFDTIYTSPVVFNYYRQMDNRQHKRF
jgi:dolichol-phosphate mannosyltransferase